MIVCDLDHVTVGYRDDASLFSGISVHRGGLSPAMEKEVPEHTLWIKSGHAQDEAAQPGARPYLWGRDSGPREPDQPIRQPARPTSHTVENRDALRSVASVPGRCAYGRRPALSRGRGVGTVRSHPRGPGARRPRDPRGGPRASYICSAPCGQREEKVCALVYLDARGGLPVAMRVSCGLERLSGGSSSSGCLYFLAPGTGPPWQALVNLNNLVTHTCSVTHQAFAESSTDLLEHDIPAKPVNT